VKGVGVQEAGAQGREAGVRPLESQRGALRDRARAAIGPLVAAVLATPGLALAGAEVGIDPVGAVDEERRRIARELHDSTSQHLAAAALDLEWALQQVDPAAGRLQATLGEALGLCLRSLDELRTLSYELHPPVLEASGLEAALRWYREAFSRQTGVRVALRVVNPGGRLPPGVERALFRVAQEALRNVHRHSGSASAAVGLTRLPGRGPAVLVVRDRGRGLLGAAPGQGLAGMRHRVEACGGRLEITSPSRGTCVRAVIPLRGA
jgi:signal transduction histidine kinase